MTNLNADKHSDVDVLIRDIEAMDTARNDGRIDLEEFYMINAAHPQILLPIFTLQQEIIALTFGTAWWAEKKDMAGATAGDNTRCRRGVAAGRKMQHVRSMRAQHASATCEQRERTSNCAELA